MKTTTLIGLGTLALLLTAPAFSQITFYEGEQFHGRAFTTRDAVTDFSRRGFNDRASSVRKASNRPRLDDRNDLARPEPLAEPRYDYRCRTDDRVFDLGSREGDS